MSVVCYEGEEEEEEEDSHIAMVQVCQECSNLLREAESASHDCMLQQQQLDALRRAVNPYSAEYSRLSQLQAESQEALGLLDAQKADLQHQVTQHASVCCSMQF